MPTHQSDLPQTSVGISFEDREAVQPCTATVAMLVEALDRNALVSEASRFTGAELVYANLEDATIARVRDALTYYRPSKDEAQA